MHFFFVILIFQNNQTGNFHQIYLHFPVRPFQASGHFWRFFGFACKNVYCNTSYGCVRLRWTPLISTVWFWFFLFKFLKCVSALLFVCQLHISRLECVNLFSSCFVFVFVHLKCAFSLSSRFGIFLTLPSHASVCPIDWIQLSNIGHRIGLVYTVSGGRNSLDLKVNTFPKSQEKGTSQFGRRPRKTSGRYTAKTKQK